MWPFKSRSKGEVDQATSTEFTKDQALLFHAITLCGQGRYDEALALANDRNCPPDARKSITEMAQLGIDLRKADRQRAVQKKSEMSRPNDYEVYSRVASALDAFIRQEGLQEFREDRLHIAIRSDFSVFISTKDRLGGAFLSAPLKELGLDLSALGHGEPVRQFAIDQAARSFVTRLSIR